MRRVYLAQINTGFGGNAFLPYSAGLLWSRASSDPRLASTHELAGLLCQRFPLERTLGMISSPDILGLSCYVWNWRYSMSLARMVREAWPGCRVVIGGPEVPNDSDGFLESHPFVDVLVHGEGEEAFTDILLAMAGHGDIADVAGISIRGPDGTTRRTRPRQRSSDIDSIPSPYVSGVFDELMSSNPQISWHASQETHRGCPYSCTFCDWGSAVYTKIREFSSGRLLEEMDWFSGKGIDLLYNCDANYGILRRDLELTSELTARKARTGYPRKFRASYAKRSDDKVFEISRMLNDAGMSKGVTLSLQSLDPHALEATKRSNITMDNFAGLVSRYRDSGIPTYTEVILGLPGETPGGFADGIDSILEAGQHDGLNVYPCMLLRNSELAGAGSRLRHGIESVTIPIGSNHGSPDGGGVQEYQDIIVGTATMDRAGWRRSYMLSWMVQALHCMGPTQLLAMIHRLRHGSYAGFYSMLLDEFAGSDTLLGAEIGRVGSVLDGVLAGERGFDSHDPEYGDVMWPPEEFSFLRIMQSSERFYGELHGVARRMAGPALAGDIMRFQERMVLDHISSSDAVVETGHDVLGFYEGCLRGNVSEPTVCRGITRFASGVYFGGDISAYAREVVWYGRKQGLHRMGMEREL